MNMNIEEWFYSLPLRLRAFLRPNLADQEMKEELDAHVEQQIRENIAKGMSPEEARRSAVHAMGGIAQIEEECRDARRGSILHDFVQDLRYGFRQLRRSPGFSALAILCLTLGIGANAAVFSWLEGILFRPYRWLHIRTGCSQFSEPYRARVTRTSFPGRTSSTCAGTARCAKTPLSRRLPPAR